ncbi:hypothetical protein [Jeotgalibacillus soli]|uniref:Uncharacterized protein n=1 Tax=Jeotgalibacillus soli TaxID=889306 RepID=A0A0C2W7L8_9BACL|nr:hypothetical protein [Jeotgalibacillus soli]KIL51998.1 hypothetical protein KP78_03680 [Jeotgalibacillus soli]
MKTGLRLDEYTKDLWEKRESEIKKIDPFYETAEKLSSPPGSWSSEIIRIFSEYKELANLLSVIEAIPDQKKSLILMNFFKMKRYQPVVVYSHVGEELESTTGRVSTAGRDFVLLTTINNRIWIPYHTIHSTNIPSGVPVYSNTHQYVIYDNNLKEKLLTNFGEVVSKRDVLIQQFFDETLRTNLRSWVGLWVKVETAEKTLYGKIIGTSDHELSVSLLDHKEEVDLRHIRKIVSTRFLPRLSLLRKKFFRELF